MPDETTENTVTEVTEPASTVEALDAVERSDSAAAKLLSTCSPPSSRRWGSASPTRS
ncbi:hypothetical protein [Promicromonospora soli]